MSVPRQTESLDILKKGRYGSLPAARPLSLARLTAPRTKLRRAAEPLFEKSLAPDADAA